jgi:hypothetical protein
VILLRHTQLVISLLFLTFTPLQAQSSAPSPTHLAHEIVLPIVQPSPTPDYTKQILDPIHSRLIALQTHCKSVGGTLDGQTCKLPPPPPPPLPAPSIAPTPVIQAPVIEVSTNWYKQWIYNEESGNNPEAINRYSGACGLGQALPCSKMPCSLSDYTCQDNYFTSYMLSRYGSWQAAYEYHIRVGWW